MRILSAQLPKIIEYYVSPGIQNLINESFDSAEVSIYNDTIEMNIPNSNEVYEALKVIKDKTQTTTIGNGKKLYEYELDVSIKDGHIFIFILDDGNSYTCNMSDVSLDKYNNIRLKFII